MSLEELKFGQWEMPEFEIPPAVRCSTDATVAYSNAASQAPSTSPELKILQFPMDKKFLSVPLSSLFHVVHRFPRLTLLECYITISSPATLEFDLDAHITPHALEILSIDGPISSQEEQIAVATYLSLLFPHLKAIEAPDGSTNDWRYVYSLIKMCQMVVEKHLQQSTVE